MNTLKIVITLILFIILTYMVCMNRTQISGFANSKTELPDISSSGHFVHTYDNNGNRLNVILIAKPFTTPENYMTYMNNKNKFIFLGISSYMEFPSMPSNPIDNYMIEEFTNKMNPYNLKMYFDLCEGWLHCFKNPIKYIPMDKPNVLISESDFVNYKTLVPDNTEKIYDFIYSCPKVNKESSCDDWVSINKNWELAKKCLPILCGKYNLKGMLIGRDGCIDDLNNDIKKNITTTGWLEYNDMIVKYKQSKWVFVPNIIDASPRIITEALSLNLPCIMNNNILGGWKYINDKTGMFFTDENDLSSILDKFLPNLNKYTPREFIINNYGPINTGIRLKKFLFEHFNKRLNIADCKYITIRHPVIKIL